MADVQNWLNRHEVDTALEESRQDIEADRVSPMEQVFDEIYAELDAMGSKRQVTL